MVLSIIATLALTAAPEQCLAGLPIHYDVRVAPAIAGYLNRPGLAPPEFEFAPLSGQGMPEVAAFVNWASNSDNGAAWGYVGQSGGVAPTYVSGGMETGPEGYASFRVQVPATTTTQGSRFNTSAAGQMGFAVTGYDVAASVWVKGYAGASGVIDVYVGDGNAVTAGGCGCAFNGTSWTLCTSANASNHSFAGMYAGNLGSYCGSGTRAALDVLVSSAGLHASTARQAYCSTGLANACVARGPITGRDGEAIQYSNSTNIITRGTDALRLTNIGDADLVHSPGTGGAGCLDCARVQIDADGVRGVLAEKQVVNSILRNRAFENAIWIPQNSGAPGAVVVVANAVRAPVNQVVADTLAIPAVSAGQHSYLGQTFTATAAPWSASVYLRGNTTSGTAYLFFRNGATYHSTACNLVADSWTRCVVEGVTLTAASWEFGIGVDLRDPAQSAQSAFTVRAFGAQGEASERVTSLVITETVSVTRIADTYRFVRTTPMAPASMAASVQLRGLTGAYLVCGHRTSTDLFAIGTSASVATATRQTPALSATQGTLGAGTVQRVAGYTYGQGGSAVIGACVAGACAEATGTSTTTATGHYTDIGYNAYSPTTGQPNGIISRVCVDPNPSRCR